MCRVSSFRLTPPTKGVSWRQYGGETMTDYTGYTTQVPAEAEHSWQAGTLGERWRTTTDGYAVALRFYKGGTLGGGLHILLLYTAAGTELARITSSDTGVTSGWITKTLTNAIAISSTTSYMTAVYWPAATGRYPETTGLHTATLSASGGNVMWSPAASAGAGNGTYNFSTAPSFPTSDLLHSGTFNDFVLRVGGTPTTLTTTGVVSTASFGDLAIICPIGF